MRKLAAIVLLATVLAASGAAARTVVRVEPNGIKVVTIMLPQGTVVIQCDRANVPVSWSGPTQGMNLADICRRN